MEGGKGKVDTPHLLRASFVIGLANHGALVTEASHVVPPHPWLAAITGQAEHTELPQIFLRPNTLPISPPFWIYPLN